MCMCDLSFYAHVFTLNDVGGLINSLVTVSKVDMILVNVIELYSNFTGPIAYIAHFSFVLL